MAYIPPKSDKQSADVDGRHAINLNIAFDIRDKYNAGELSFPEASLAMITYANCDVKTIKALLPLKQ